ncbi:MAG: HlyD family efflux transporter periplasmic adaptor subunit [Planctomycetota bacterium]
MKRTLVWIAVVLVAAAALVLPRLLESLQVTTAEVRQGRVRAWVEERAETSLPRVWHVTMPVDGRVLPITLEAGDPVARDQVVARLDPADLDTRLAVAEAELAGIGTDLELNARKNFEELTLVEYGSLLEAVDRVVQASREKEKASAARVGFADKALRSKLESYEKNATSGLELWQAELDKAESDVGLTNDRLVTSALLAMRAAFTMYPSYVNEYVERKAVGRSGLLADQAGARARLEQARRDRGRVEVRSPIEGVVLARHHDEERVLAAGTPLLDLGRRAELEVTAELLSQEALGVRPGMPVELFGAGLEGHALSGKVLRVGPRAFTKLSSLGVEEQRVEVRISIDALPPMDELPLGVGYRLRARIFIGEADGALAVPRRALLRGDGGRSQVFVVEAGHARLVDVELGLVNDDEAQVRAGLAAGARVVLSPPSKLEDGMRVR